MMKNILPILIGCCLSLGCNRNDQRFQKSSNNNQKDVVFINVIVENLSDKEIFDVGVFIGGKPVKPGMGAISPGGSSGIVDTPVLINTGQKVEFEIYYTLTDDRSKKLVVKHEENVPDVLSKRLVLKFSGASTKIPLKISWEN